MGIVKATSPGSSLKNMLVPKKKAVILGGIGNCRQHSERTSLHRAFNHCFEDSS